MLQFEFKVKEMRLYDVYVLTFSKKKPMLKWVKQGDSSRASPSPWVKVHIRVRTRARQMLELEMDYFEVCSLSSHCLGL